MLKKKKKNTILYVAHIHFYLCNVFVTLEILAILKTSVAV